MHFIKPRSNSRYCVWLSLDDLSKISFIFKFTSQEVFFFNFNLKYHIKHKSKVKQHHDTKCLPLGYGYE